MAIHLELEEEPINTTPMIDVAFNLLIFFMLSATFISEEQELDIRLPQVSIAAPLTEAPDELTVQVTADGKFVIDGDEFTSERLVARLKRALAELPDRKVSVRGHKQTPYENVAKVFALARQAGVTKVAARVLEER
ncbi:MAG TPA: biopolymer transporter ExbD [Planctomycetia bacterium]|nr:biopolymer transporter ExbD [Planctomycetia bacterium]